MYVCSPYGIIDAIPRKKESRNNGRSAVKAAAAVKNG
jgi:hypothetical protein